MLRSVRSRRLAAAAGLTGGTGSGKSTVAHRLGERGAFVVDADVLAREVVAPGSEGLAAVVEEFGPEVLAPDGALDRTALAAVVFGDDGRRRALEAITHPLIAHRTGELVAAAPDDAVLVHDVPLLVEKRMGAGYHLVVVVDAPVEDRVRRLVGRGMPEDDARRRIASQADDEQRRAAADVWLENAGTPQQLERAVDRLWDERLVPFRDLLVSGRPAARRTRDGGAPGDPAGRPAGARPRPDDARRPGAGRPDDRRRQRGPRGRAEPRDGPGRPGRRPAAGRVRALDGRGGGAALRVVRPRPTDRSEGALRRLRRCIGRGSHAASLARTLKEAPGRGDNHGERSCARPGRATPTSARGGT